MKKIRIYLLITLGTIALIGSWYRITISNQKHTPLSGDYVMITYLPGSEPDTTLIENDLSSAELRKKCELETDTTYPSHTRIKYLIMP